MRAWAGRFVGGQRSKHNRGATHKKHENHVKLFFFTFFCCEIKKKEIKYEKNFCFNFSLCVFYIEKLILSGQQKAPGQPDRFEYQMRTNFRFMVEKKVYWKNHMNQKMNRQNNKKERVEQNTLLDSTGSSIYLRLFFSLFSLWGCGPMIEWFLWYWISI